MKKYLLVATLLASLAFFLQCTNTKDSEGTSRNPYETSQTYFHTMTGLNVEVAYEVGAEPAVGNGFGQPLWNFLKANLASLFQGRAIQPVITVPTTLAQMKSFADRSKSVWNANELLSLAKELRNGTSTATDGDFIILFLNGNLDDGTGQPNNNVLGVQVTGTSVIAIFKNVIRNNSSGSAYIGKYLEQSTLVHEMGHALGLVNAGIPLKSSHQDAEHGAHCSNTSCALYWANEGASAARQFVITYITTGNEVIYGNECLNDARNF
ncbi:MAG: hypothetical protein EOP06_07895 [Proteobacteria bacterium]|nr:MAG: hypothetical protein EOP06_07895 [Pseudomonadota bacterium]